MVDDASRSQTILSAGIDMHLQAVMACMEAVQDDFVSAVEICQASLLNGGKIVLCGNGGSAADAQHIAAELTIRFTVNRPALAALALTTDTSALTACGNDLGFDQIFARQVEALVRHNDVVIGISTSGCSRNVMLALQKARGIGAKTIGLTGGTGGELPTICDATLCAPSVVTARIQEIHIMLGHLLCEALEKGLGYY